MLKQKVYLSLLTWMIPVFELNTEKYGPEITTYMDTFHAVSKIIDPSPATLKIINNRRRFLLLNITSNSFITTVLLQSLKGKSFYLEGFMK